jgi:hypothetical protein
VIAVVVDLLDRLRGDPGEHRVGGGAEPLVQGVQVVGRGELAHDGVREVAVRLLEQVRRAEVALVAPVRQVVLGAAVRRAGVAQQRAGVAEQVEGDVRQGDVLLQLRRAGDPAAEALSEHEGVVAEPERVLRDLGRRRNVGGDELVREGHGAELDVAGFRGRGPGGCVRHRCFTPSAAV